MAFEPIAPLDLFQEPLPDITTQPPEQFTLRANATVLQWNAILQQMNQRFSALNANMEYLNGVALFSMVTAATSRPVTMADSGFQRYIRSSAAVTLTFQATLPVGAQFNIRCAGPGNVTLSGDGVILHPPKGGTLVMQPGDTATVVIVSPGVADVMGSTGAAA